MENVTARMSEEELDLLDRLAAERGGSRSHAIRGALPGGGERGADSNRPGALPGGEGGDARAAEIAGVTIAEMMHEANERGVLSNYDEADLESDVLDRADESGWLEVWGDPAVEHVETAREQLGRDESVASLAGDLALLADRQAPTTRSTSPTTNRYARPARRSASRSRGRSTS